MVWTKCSTIIVLITVLFSEVKAVKICSELRRKVEIQRYAIKRLENELQEYRLGYPVIKDVPDLCNAYITCSDCLHKNTDSNCGWCFLRNRCSFEEHCLGNGTDTNSWITQNDARCPSVKEVTPDIIPYSTARMVEISIPHLPAYDGAFICSFDVLNKTFLTTGTRKDEGIVCPSPRSDHLPQMEPGTSFVNVKISVRLPHGPDFLSTTNFTYYECGLFDSCTTCASNLFPCSWCVEGNRCTHDWGENCRNDILVDSDTPRSQSPRKGSRFCPQILEIDSHSSEILIPSGTGKRISATVENVMMFIASQKFLCVVQGFPAVNANLLSDTIYCDTIDFHILDGNPITNVSFDVVWDLNKKLSNPRNIHVVVYDCSLMADSCGMCLELPSQYQCGWCEETNTCGVRDGCSSSWVDKNGRCTKPVIRSFHPRYGLASQETNITINGINFGKEFKDIDGGIRLVTPVTELTVSNCRPYEELYVKTQQIVCQLDSLLKLSDSDSVKSHIGYFEVKVQNEFMARSEEIFKYVNPNITSIHPVKGPKSGGTLLEINGNYLDAGGEVGVYVADVPCKIISSNSAKIQCITSESSDTRSGKVQVKYGSEVRESPTYFFYVEVPYVNNAKTNYFKEPRGTPSGVSTIHVEGENFDSVLNTYIFVSVGEEEYMGICLVENPTSMKCKSPRVPAEKLVFEEDGFVELNYGFKMDGALDVSNSYNSFRMYPDPSFSTFTEDGKIKILRGDYLTIHGENIDKAFSEADLRADIGTEECLVVAMSRTQLTCRPPSTQPPSKGGDSHKIPEVVVKVAGVMEFFIGYLKYDKTA